MKYLLFVIAIFLPAILFSQYKLDAKEGGYSFSEMQKHFNDWKKTNDINDIRGWKTYKRWEYDQLFHLDAKGEPVSPEYYLQQLIEAQNQKRNLNRIPQTNNWMTEGPSVLPPSNDPYMQHGLGRINCIAFHPNDPNTYWVGVAQGGVWKTSDDGNSWTPLTDALPILRVSDIVVDPNNTDIIYISLCDFEYIDVSLTLDYRKRNTHYGLGVYKSTDGGANWQATGLAYNLIDGEATLIRKILINSNNSNQLLAAGTDGMYLSNDGGANWNKQLDSLFWDLVQDPSSPNTVYATTGFLNASQQGNASIMKSTDFGSTWTVLNSGIPSTNVVERIKLAIAPSDPTCIYAVTTDLASGLHGIYKSTNAGVNWNLQFDTLNILDWDNGTNIGGQGTYDLVLAVNPTNKDIVYVGGVNLWGSTDGAGSFNPISYWVGYYGPSIHADQHMLSVQPTTNRFFMCNDGGIYHSANLLTETWDNINIGSTWPTVWTNISDGLAITSYYRISSSRTNDGRILVGAQDNSTTYFDGTSWTAVIGGDGMDNVLDPNDAFTFIGMWQYGGMAKTIDGGFNFNYFNASFENGEWTTPITLNYADGMLYTGYENVHVSSDFGDTWNQISNFPAEPGGFYNPEICALAVSNSNPQVIMAARRPRYEYNYMSKLYRTNNGGTSWQNITAGLEDSLYFTSVEISDDDDQIAWVTCAGFSAGNKIFRTLDGGNTWDNISYDLPDLPVNIVKQIPGSPVHAILVGTDVGVYYLDDTTFSWTSWSNGLPNVIVTDIEPNMAENKIYISTFGRGVWSMDISAPVGINSTDARDLLFNIYPVPVQSSQLLNIQFNQSTIGKMDISIFDITGKLVYTVSLESNPLMLNRTINPQLAKGTYVMRIIGNGFEGEKKFVVD